MERTTKIVMTSRKRKHGSQFDNYFQSDNPVENDKLGLQYRKAYRAATVCHRCRLRKTKCDKNYPSCGSCIKANVECVGIDPATGREIPRSYVSHLEDRVAFLETELSQYKKTTTGHTLQPQIITPSPAYDPLSPVSVKQSSKSALSPIESTESNFITVNGGPSSENTENSYLGASSGLSFARLLLAAMKQSSEVINSAKSSSLDAKSAKIPSQKPLDLPTKYMAEQLLSVYFNQSNPQMPIIHREAYLKRFFEPVYGLLSPNVSLASEYTSLSVERAANDATLETAPLEQICANKDDNCSIEHQKTLYFLHIIFAIASSTRQSVYPSSVAQGHYLAASRHYQAVINSPDRLEALQGILLNAVYSIMRPTVPSIWYVLGSAMRLAVDLGLHSERRKTTWDHTQSNNDPIRQDFKRRLFWCTYAMDRQICVYLGRPFGIPEASIRVELFSELDDTLISKENIPKSCDFSLEHSSNAPSYKHISLCFIKLRQIQGEVESVLYEKEDYPRRFMSLDEWKSYIILKLDEWHNRLPRSPEIGNCNFNGTFFDLNYHQTRLLIYGMSPLIPVPSEESYHFILDSGSQIIQLYQELFLARSLNYTWAAVHNLFVAGSSYLYALYHSRAIRNGTEISNIEENVKACHEVLGSFIQFCSGALECQNMFELLSQAIIKLCIDEKSGANNHCQLSTSSEFVPSPCSNLDSTQLKSNELAPDTLQSFFQQAAQIKFVGTVDKHSSGVDTANSSHIPSADQDIYRMMSEVPTSALLDQFLTPLFNDE